MGYYTEYSMTVKKIKDQNQFEELVNELRSRNLMNYAFWDATYNDEKHSAYFQSYDSVKWYDYPKDMPEISRRFPNMYFELEGRGEEFGDFWRTYYHDSETEECRGDLVYEKPCLIDWESA